MKLILGHIYFLRQPGKKRGVNKSLSRPVNRPTSGFHRSLQTNLAFGLVPHYPIAEAMVKIGKYIAITMNPMTTPKNTIIIGSSNDVSDATA